VHCTLKAKVLYRPRALQSSEAGGAAPAHITVMMVSEIQSYATIVAKNSPTLLWVHCGQQSLYSVMTKLYVRQCVKVTGLFSDISRISETKSDWCTTAAYNMHN